MKSSNLAATALMACTAVACGTNPATLATPAGEPAPTPLTGNLTLHPADDPGSCLTSTNTPSGVVSFQRCDAGLAAQQQWWFSTDHGDKWQQVTDNNGLCLNLPHNKTENGARLQLYPCQENDQASLWSFQAKGSEFVIHPARNGDFCLDIPGWELARPSELWTCNGGSNQRFVVE